MSNKEPASTAAQTRFVVAAAGVTQTRPNNVTAYAAGQVYGSAADARYALTVPALPADALGPGFTSIGLLAVQNVNLAQAAPVFNVYLFDGSPATVLGDQATIALSDADIALLVLGSLVTTITMSNNAAQASMLNQGAGTAGRRGSSTSSFPVTTKTGKFLTGGQTVGVYLAVQAAYTPLALEAVTLYAAYGYSSRQL